MEKLMNNPHLVFQDGSNIPFSDMLEYLLPTWFRTAFNRMNGSDAIQ
jgi:hypothetical protein